MFCFTFVVVDVSVCRFSYYDNGSWTAKVLDLFWFLAGYLGASWGVWGTSSRRLGASWERLGAPWEGKPSWSRFGAVLEASWKRLGDVLGRLGSVLGASCGRLGGFLGRLVGLLGRLRASWSHLVLDFILDTIFELIFKRLWLRKSIPELQKIIKF